VVSQVGAWVVKKNIMQHKAQWVTIFNEESESMRFTLEVLSDPELIEQIKMSREDHYSWKIQEVSRYNEIICILRHLIFGYESNNNDDFFDFIDLEQDTPSFLEVNFPDSCKRYA